MATETTSSLVPSQSDRLKIFLHALLFVFGFSLVFVIGWGGSVTALGQLFGTYKRVIAQMGGVIVIAFGLATLELIRIPWFYADTRAQYTGQRGTYGGSALMGIFFAAGWSPCIGPILATVLGLAREKETVSQGVFLLAVYSAGLGLPFLLTSFGLNTFFGFYTRFKRHFHALEVASGVLVIAVGILFVTNKMTMLNSWFSFLNRFVM